MFKFDVQRLLHPSLHPALHPFLGVSLLMLLALFMLLGSVSGLWRAWHHVPTEPAVQDMQAPAYSSQADQIFGSYQTPLAQTTSEKLTLQGIFMGASSTAGSAIIALRGHTGHLYVVGDTLPGGAILSAVHASEVDLDVQGQRSTLVLPKKHL